MDSLISALTLSYLLPAAAHIFLFLPIRQWLLRVEYFSIQKLRSSSCTFHFYQVRYLVLNIFRFLWVLNNYDMFHSYFRQVRNNQYENNTKGCAAVTSPLPWHILSYYLLFFTILLNDSCGFHMYVLPRGCAHGENTSHLDYTQVFH